ncbi:MAG: hypothetical protein JKZ03_07435 [Flavobacteriaceae bacterium]|nr:hypothetical protein [Flavobacteriaceae bacterium]
MKSFFLIFIFLFSTAVFAQPNTDVFLFDISIKEGNISISNLINISDNEGYDNQPSFIDNSTVLFSSTRNKQTDILQYDIKTGNKTWLSDTQGGEYSPLQIPSKNAVSAIRLDPDGKQLLYSYDKKTGVSTPLVNDLKIGYHTWISENIFISFVLGNPPTLVVSDLKNNSNTVIDSKIGRSLHKIPNTELISYVSKEKEDWVIRSLNPLTGVKVDIANTPDGSEDMCWMPNGTILMGKGSTLYKYTPKADINWVKIVSIKNFGLKNISRLSVSPDGTKLALVAQKI